MKGDVGMKLYVEDSNGALYEHANLRTNTTGQPFDLWLDEAGCYRNIQHNEPRVKVKENGVELDIILHKDGTLEIVNNARDIQKFKHSKEALDFIERYRDVITMHWNHEIETGDVVVTMRKFKNKLATKDEILDIIEKAMNGEI